MGTVLFAILDTASHLNASFKIAHALQSRGHQITYLAKPSSEKMIRVQGFDFQARPEEFQQEVLLRKVKYTEQVIGRMEDNFLKMNLFDEAISLINPGLVLLDTSLIYYTLHLLHRNIPIITVSTKVCQDKTEFIPPFQSGYVPLKRNLLTWLKVECIWAIHLLRKQWRNYRDNSSPVQISWFYLVKRYLRQTDPKIDIKINVKRSSHFGLKDIPELILSPRHFDFPRPIPKNQMYMGPIVDVYRKEDPNEIAQIGKILSDTDKTVYCAMGSYDIRHRLDRAKFFVKLINIFLLHKSWRLVLSLGKNLHPSGFTSVPDNVFLFQTVPQLHVIKQADLVICHGGMQTVTECILLETPMLVFPLNKKLDQPGNAARVVYHKIGLSGNLKRDKPKVIEEKIDMLFDKKDSFVDNIKHLKRQMLISGDFEKGMEFIESYMQCHASINEKA
ncbi:UDP:flavonoid glycosyltransferase YjiC, YdhE family [Cyclobacterium xiamenense]|uniref:UDP:flavonoid glycosyltransferase YjiC, YdhE family n=1 Tax=Cyclobacterium xiamenense TaxID=1297121 RepID=A0A1H7AAK1_9BACT|nr:glycosyltransferase [Cyclobacterium xiamenense]SEJ58900.1 UDP:flavonoid glycosyltransferase YjiC, YdhE family [Cyclobacterium xiamenense]